MNGFQVTVFGVLLALSGVAQAKSIATYQVRVESPEAGSLYGVNTRGKVSIGGGWTCQASVKEWQNESLRNYAGQTVNRPQSKSYELGYSLLSKPGMTAVIERQIVEQAAEFAVYLEETCEETHLEQRYTGTDSNGNPQYTWVSETDYHRLRWKCPVANAPQSKATTARVNCEVEHSNGYSTPSAKLARLKRSPMIAEVSLVGVSERHEIDLCPWQKGGNKMTLALRGGLGGHRGENDFVVKMELDGAKPIEIKIPDGLLNHDVAYCPKGDFRVKISGLEKDLLFDDKYVPMAPKGLSFRAGERGEGSVYLKRRSYTGFTSKISQILVSAYPAGKAEESEPRDAGGMRVAETHR